jgi:hypothetical protein
MHEEGFAYMQARGVDWSLRLDRERLLRAKFAVHALINL